MSSGQGLLSIEEQEKMISELRAAGCTYAEIADAARCTIQMAFMVCRRLGVVKPGEQALDDLAATREAEALGALGRYTASELPQAGDTLIIVIRQRLLERLASR